MELLPVYGRSHADTIASSDFLKITSPFPHMHVTMLLPNVSFLYYISMYNVCEGIMWTLVKYILLAHLSFSVIILW